MLASVLWAWHAVSEYQYYEFRAVDRPLTQREMVTLRRSSSRAEVSPTSYVNTYNYGDFPRDPSRWVARYFDAFLYVANWASRELMFRIPRRHLDPAVAKRYLCGESASVTAKGPYVTLRFRSESESDDSFEDGDGWLDRLLPLREEIIAGDLRALYLGWLLSVEQDELADGESEPPVPPGLSTRSTSLAAFSKFLRVNGRLTAAAARAGPKIHRPTDRAVLDQFIARLPKVEAARWLRRLATEDAVYAKVELLRKARGADGPTQTPPSPPRTVGELRIAAKRRRRAGCNRRNESGSPSSPGSLTETERGRHSITD